MKIASFTIQNLFHRDKSFKEKSLGKCMTNWMQELDTLMHKSNKSFSDQDRIRELSFLIGFDKTASKPYAVLRRRAGDLYLKGSYHSYENKANNLSNWNGWLEIQTTPISPEATVHKAQVIAEANADILLLHEIEDRASLEEFNHQLLPKFKCTPYAKSFVYQTDKMNGLNSGILLRENYRLNSIKTHEIGEIGNKKETVIEYEILTPDHFKIWILSVSLPIYNEKKEIADALLKNQIQQLSQLYEQLLLEGKITTIITGTFNAPSYSNSLAPLLQKTNLKDITKHLSFEVICDEGADANYFRLGAYQKGVNIQQKDYMLLSPILFTKLQDSGLNRKAVWPDKRPQWSIYKTITHKNKAASEHPLVWGKLSNI